MKTALIFIVAIVYEIIPPVLSEDVSSSEGKVIHEEILNEMPYLTPKPTGNAFLSESFDDLEDFNKRWMISKAKKDDSSSEDISKYSGVWSVEPAESDNIKKDLGLVLKSKAKHHAISVKLDKPYVFDGKPFVLQYEVRFQNGQECGGAYIKLLTDDKDFSLENFHDKVPYTVMFGPDKCGNDAKLHFIFRHKNPKNNSIEEKHWKKTPNVPKFEEIFSDKKPHLFTLIVKPDDQFEVKLDNQVIQKGNLLEEFEPPVNPPAEIDDPEDFKPEDWDDKPKIPDPDDFKPDDWDEDAPKEILDMKAEKPSGWLDDEDDTIDDPDAVKPDDWDDDMDGEWEPPKISNPKCQSSPGCGEWKRPMIPNPEYKGKWKPSMIENPNYKGVWKPRRIPNPDFFEDKKPYYMMPIGAVGFELWSMSDGILFDNIIITDDVAVARKFAEDSFDVKKEKADAESDSAFTRFIRYSNNRPWLWAVYLLLIAVPLVLFITFCCPSSSNKEENSIGEKKKNDTFEVDDVIQEENEDNQPEDQKDQDVNGEEINDENEVLDEVEEESEPARRTSPRRRKPRIE